MTISAKIAFMKRLQAIDVDNLHTELAGMAVEAANLFPMIADVADDEHSRLNLLAKTINVVTERDGSVNLTLEQNILIDSEGRIVDGRNRLAAIIGKFGLPTFDFDQEHAWAAFTEARAGNKAGSAMDLLKGLAEGNHNGLTGSDLIFAYLDVDAASSQEDVFERIITRNMARRDLNTSQRACVAARAIITQAAFKRMTGVKKATDEAVAESFGVSHKTLKRAKAVLKADKGIFDKVANGELALGRAEALLKLTAGAVRAAKAEDEGLGDAAVATKTPKAKGSAAVTIYNDVAVENGIASKENADDAIFAAIGKGLIARFEDRAEALAKVEEALKELFGYAAE